MQVEAGYHVAVGVAHGRHQDGTDAAADDGRPGKGGVRRPGVGPQHRLAGLEACLDGAFGKFRRLLLRPGGQHFVMLGGEEDATRGVQVAGRELQEARQDGSRVGGLHQRLDSLEDRLDLKDGAAGLGAIEGPDVS